MAYAADTKVPVARSQAELEAMLRRYGADQFGYATQDGLARIQFRENGRVYRFDLPLPTADFRSVTHTPTGRARAAGERVKALDQEHRRRWRALVLIVKAKLEAAESGITSFADEFLPYTLLPDGTTVGEHVDDELHEAYETGAMPTNLLPTRMTRAELNA